MKNYYVFATKIIDIKLQTITLLFDDYNHVLVYVKTLLEDETVLNVNIEWELVRNEIE